MKRILLLFGLALSLPVFAQTGDTASYSFSLDQAVKFALENQKDVKNALLEEQIAKQKVNEVMGMGLPQINASFDLRYFIEIPTSLVPAEFFGGPPGSFAAVQFGTKYNATAGLDASQLIFSGDYFLGVKASKVFREISQRSTERTRIETSTLVSKAYYTVLINRERSTLMDANMARVKKTMDDTKAFLDNGFVEKIDHDRLTVIYNNLLVEKEKVDRLLALGTYLLKYQMGMEINAKLQLTDNISNVKFEAASIAATDKFDYAKRVEYGLFETQFKLAKLDLKRNRFSYLPSAFAYGSLSGAAQRNEFDIFDSDKRWYPTALIGAKVTMPIFTGMQRHSRNQQAKLKLQQAENNLEFIERSIDLELASSTATLQNAASSLEIQKKNIVLAEDVARVAKIKYEQGVGSNLELITAETALKEAQTNYYNALFDALVAKLDFDKANGLIK
ncbi:MAG: TolC family protein [Bacteroidota bacterium]|nr:TolC family protein [Bacteroidota bacterium]